MTLSDKRQAHERFWQGEGPCLILIPPPEPDMYEPAGYRERFENPRLMWEYEIGNARAVLDWPTDGIPTVRPNLGVVFVPAIAGQAYELREGQMPWPGAPLSEQAIRAIPEIDVTETDLMRRATEFYERHLASGEREIVAYHPDTQGAFDTAHLLYGEAIFCDAIDPSRLEWMHELLGICLDLYLRVTNRIKAVLGEKTDAIIHGHGTTQGIYFPHAGARVSEDAAILFSPQTIAEIIMPYVEAAARPYGGAFAHYCGRHEGFFEQLCQSPLIRAIDLQPGMHDARWLLEQCAATGTVLYSRIEAKHGEDWPAYTRRVAALVRDTGARCILRPMAYPQDRAACAEMLAMWHELT